MTRCYCYYEPVGMYDDHSQRALIDVWARSWRKQGWDPIVLNPGDAMQHPMWERFEANVSKLPSEYGPLYDKACFRRWLAMAAQTSGKHGGGLLLDYDVINYRMTPFEPEPDKMVLFCETRQSICMGCVMGTQAHYEFMSNLMANWKVGPEDWNDSTTYRGYHCSDLSMLVRMFDGKNWPKPEWLVKEPGVQGFFPRETFRTAPVVHYGFEMKAAGFFPKYQHIERLRPF